VKASKPGESALLLLDVVEVLASSDIDYAVVGAMAASLHGAVRASVDADALLSVDPREAGRLQRQLEAAGFSVELGRGDSGDPIAAVLRVGDPYGNRVDLLAGLRGMEPGIFARVVSVPFQDGALKFVGREDFIAMKAFAGGPVDLLDASRAMDAAGQLLDTDLLRRLAAGYGRDAVAVVEKLLAGQR
jgi:hypothetical protein